MNSDLQLKGGINGVIRWLFSTEAQGDLQRWLPCIVVGVVLLVMLSLALSNVTVRTTGRFVRGTRLVGAHGYWLKHWFWSSRALAVGRVRYPARLETGHLLMTGSPSSGKSQAIIGLLGPLRVRGEGLIAADVGGEALRDFGRPGDLILNPLDARSVAWSPFSEMTTASDANRLAKSMIPDPIGNGSEREWFAYSQSLVAAVMRRLWENGNATNGSMLHALTMAPSAELKLLVQGLPAQALFHDGAERMLASVRGIVSSYLSSYSYLQPDAGKDSWSIRRHVCEGKAWLWMPYRDDQAATLRPLLATWIGEAVSAMLSLPSDRARRHWLILDEVASLGRVQGLTDALTKGRKYGLCAVLGLQSVAQLRDVYGEAGAQTLLACLGSQLILRANDPETAAYASRNIGRCEVELAVITKTKDGRTITHQLYEKDAVLASQISALPDRRGYLRFAGDARVRRVEVPRVKSVEHMEAFKPCHPSVAEPLPTPPPLIVPRRPPLDADAILGTGSNA